MFEEALAVSARQIGERIKARRRELRVTQPHLAELAGVSVNTVCKVERGQGNPTLGVLLRIAEILGLELSLDVRKGKINA